MAYVQGSTSSDPIIMLGNLDFYEIRDSLKNYLTESDSFSGYDFEGSALSTLLDLLTYNSVFYSYYANMIANESFLDTATKKNSVGSLVKPLSYLPASARGARATIKVTSTQEVNIGPGDAFSGNGMVWTPVRDYVVNGEREIDIMQGTWTIDNHGDFVENSQPHQRFKINSTEGLDTSTLKVYVNETGDGGVGTEWNDVNDIEGGIVGVTAGQKVYFLSSSVDGGYEVYFGDNILGARPNNNSTVTFHFLRTLGERGNGVASFTDNIVDLNVVSTVLGGAGGSNPEDIETTKQRAPLFFQTQGRAVTANDLKTTIIQSNLGLIGNAWGGEDQDPPQYGKVFITAYGDAMNEISNETKEQIKELVTKKCVVSILPVFVDPNMLDILLEGYVYYDPYATTSTQGDLLNIINQYIREYESNKLNDFESAFNYSEFAVGLLEKDSGFVGDNIIPYISKSFSASAADPITSISYSVNTELADPGGLEGTVLEGFDINVMKDGQLQNVYVVDDGNSVIRAYYSDNNALFETSVGSVFYKKGRVQLDGLHIVGDFRIRLRPRTNNVFAKGNILLNLVNDGIVLVN